MASSSGRGYVDPDPKFSTIVVSPYGRVYLVNVKTNLVHWSVMIRDEDNRNSNNKIYSAFHGKDVSDYVDAIVDARGTTRLVQYQSDKPPAVIPWISDGYVKRYLKSRYGEDVVFNTIPNATTRLETKTGRHVKHGSKKTENFIRIESTKFEIFTSNWLLQFSLYQAEFILKDEEDVRPIRVHITHDSDALRSLCNKLRVSSILINHDLWVSSRLMHPIIIGGPMNENYPNVFRGSMGGSYEVAVKSYSVNYFLPCICCLQLWEAKHSIYTPTLYGINVDDQKMHLVFELCKESLYDHIFYRQISPQGKQEFWRRRLTPKSMRKLMSTLIDGIKYLKQKAIQHKKLNPWNLVVTEDESVKVVGFSNLAKGTDELEVGEIQSLARLIALFYGKPINPLCEKSYETTRLTDKEMLDNFTEAKRLVVWMQDPNQIPPSLDEIASYPHLWEDIKKIDFFKDASGFMEPYAKDPLVKSVVDGMYHERYDYFRVRSWTNSSWKNMVSKRVIDQLEEHEKNEKEAFKVEGKVANPYSGENPRHLLRFIRNLLTHLPMIWKGQKLDEADRKWLGGDAVTLLKSFQSIFPNFLTDLYHYLRVKLTSSQRQKIFKAYYA